MLSCFLSASNSESIDADDQPPSPSQPSTFIKIIHHPHSLIAEPTIIPLEGENTVNSAQPIPVFPQKANKPWAPFRTRADFEYTETAVKGLLSKSIVDAQLRGINNSWSKHSKITLRSYADVEDSLGAARTYGVEVSKHFLNLSSNMFDWPRCSLKLDVSQKNSKAKHMNSNFRIVLHLNG